MKMLTVKKCNLFDLVCCVCTLISSCNSPLVFLYKNHNTFYILRNKLHLFNLQFIFCLPVNVFPVLKVNDLNNFSGTTSTRSAF